MATRKKFSIVITAEDKAHGALKKTQARIAAIGKSMRSAGRKMTMMLTVPIAAVGGFTIKAAAAFEASMNRVRGITKASADDFQLLREQAKLLGRTTQFSASQSADAMEAMARAGFSVEEVYAALPGVLELAASSNVELAEAATLAAGLLRGFGMEASEMTKINDALVTANLSTNTTLVSIAESLKEVAPLANSFGMDLGEVAAAAGFMGDALLEGGRGGVALRTIMLSLTSATPKAERTLQRLKIPKANLVDSENRLTSLIAVVEELEKAGASAADMNDIFGRRGVVAMTALVNRGSPALQALADKINGEDSVGESARQAAIRMEGAEGAMKELRSAVEGLQIAIGDSGLLGAFERLTDRLTLFTQSLSEANPAMLRIGTILVGILAVAGPIILFFGALFAAAAKLAPIWTGLVWVFKGIAVALGAIAAVLGVPVWVVVAAIAALAAAAALLIKYWEPVKAFFIDLGKAIAGPFNAIREAASGFGSLFGLGGPTVQLAGAGAGGGSVPLPPPAQAEVAGQIGVKIESDVPAHVTTLESSGDIEIDVDSGPGMSGF